MSNSAGFSKPLVLIAGFLVLISTPVFAYIGPGAGVGAIGTFFAIIGTVLLVIAGFLWYPIKRLIKGKKPPEAVQDAQDTQDAIDPKEPSDES